MTESQEVARRNEAIAQIEADIRGAEEWFHSVAPSHIDANQFVALCVGTVRKGDQYLKMALVQAPYTFMRAASECARLGLVPGDTYHFVAFKNTKEGIYEVTGIVDYKGEIDQIYRAGGVTAVHCHVVRGNDTFIWRPGQMDIPHHVIHANEFEQEGLANAEDRGPLTGVYAYAVMAGGGYSQPVVLGRSEIARHRRFAKTEKFWGPAWPEEGPHTVNMWKKTAIHVLFDLVPHSAEYLAERLRVASTLEHMPQQVADAHRPAVEAGNPHPPVVDGEVEEDSEDEQARKQANATIAALFRRIGMSGRDHSQARRAVCTGLLLPDEAKATAYVKVDDLTADALTHLAAELESWLGELAREAGGDNPTKEIRDRVTSYADSITADISNAEQQEANA